MCNSSGGCDTDLVRVCGDRQGRCILLRYLPDGQRGDTLYPQTSLLLFAQPQMAHLPGAGRALGTGASAEPTRCLSRGTTHAAFAKFFLPPGLPVVRPGSMQCGMEVGVHTIRGSGSVHSEQIGLQPGVEGWDLLVSEFPRSRSSVVGCKRRRSHGPGHMAATIVFQPPDTERELFYHLKGTDNTKTRPASNIWSQP